MSCVAGSVIGAIPLFQIYESVSRKPIALGYKYLLLCCKKNFLVMADFRCTQASKTLAKIRYKPQDS